MGWEDDNRRQQDEQRRQVQEEDRKRAETRRQQQAKAQRESDQASRIAAALAKKKKEEQDELLAKRRQLSSEYDQAILADDTASSYSIENAPALSRGLSNGLGGFAPPRLSANARTKPAGPYQSENEATDDATSISTAPKQTSLPPLRRYGI